MSCEITDRGEIVKRKAVELEGHTEGMSVHIARIPVLARRQEGRMEEVVLGVIRGTTRRRRRCEVEVGPRRSDQW